MSTRCNIHFVSAKGGDVEANIYRHCDGYPDGVLPDLARFFAAVRAQTSDTRFDDPEYLAAKFIVWQADQRRNNTKGLLDFISVAPCVVDHLDIEYVYEVACCCNSAEPSVRWKRPGDPRWTLPGALTSADGIG